MDVLPTIKIQDGDDYAIINERDFNPEIHQVYVDKSSKSKKKVRASVTADSDGNGDDVLIGGDVVNDE
jgi:hypothetical protein